jgi:hypothetical protein
MQIFKKSRFLAIGILSLLLINPGLLYSQTIDLEKTYNLGQDVYRNIHKEGSGYVGFYNNINPYRIMIIRFDSLLNVLSYKEVLDTLSTNDGYFFDNSFQLKSGYEYIVVGSRTGGSETVLKMDSAANIQWRQTYSYPFFSYTTINNIMLEPGDKTCR